MLYYLYKYFFNYSYFPKLSLFASNSILYAQERPEISAFLSLFRALSFTLFFTLIIISSINFNHLVALYGLIDIFIIFLYISDYFNESNKIIVLELFENFIRNPSLLCLFLAYIIFFLFFAMNFKVLSSIVVITFIFYISNIKKIFFLKIQALYKSSIHEKKRILFYIKIFK